MRAALRCSRPSTHTLTRRLPTAAVCGGWRRALSSSGEYETGRGSCGVGTASVWAGEDEYLVERATQVSPATQQPSSPPQSAFCALPGAGGERGWLRLR